LHLISIFILFLSLQKGIKNDTKINHGIIQLINRVGIIFNMIWTLELSSLLFKLLNLNKIHIRNNITSGWQAWTGQGHGVVVLVVVGPVVVIVVEVDVSVVSGVAVVEVEVEVEVEVVVVVEVEVVVVEEVVVLNNF